MIRLDPRHGTQNVFLHDERLPEDPIRVTIPEWISTRNRYVMIGPIYVPKWELRDNQHLTGHIADEEIDLKTEVTAGEDTVTVRITLTNNTKETWMETADFCCWNLGTGLTFSDYEMLRTFVWHKGGRRSAASLQRAISPRPQIQFYPVGASEPFVLNKPLAGFESTCPETLDHGAIAILSRDSRWTAMVLGENPLFVFSNGEYSCIHSCPNYGDIRPGETATRTTRLLIIRDSPGKAVERLQKLNTQDK